MSQQGEKRCRQVRYQPTLSWADAAELRITEEPARTCQVLNGRYIRMADSDGRPAYTREDEPVKLTYSNTRLGSIDFEARLLTWHAGVMPGFGKGWGLAPGEKRLSVGL